MTRLDERTIDAHAAPQVDEESLRRVRRGAKRASESARLDALKRHCNDADAAIAELTASVDASALASLVSMGAEVGAAKTALRATGGNVDAAAALLLEAPPRPSRNSRRGRRRRPICRPTTRTARPPCKRRANSSKGSSAAR